MVLITHLKSKTKNTAETDFKFWQQWLFYSSLFFVLIGLLIALYGSNIFFLPYHKAIAKILFHDSAYPADVEIYRRYLCGPFGGTMACCYLLLAFIAKYPFANKEAWARNAIILSFGIWAIIDSAVCLYYKVYFQVYLLNGISLLLKMLPILFTWKYFKK